MATTQEQPLHKNFQEQLGKPEDDLCRCVISKRIYKYLGILFKPQVLHPRA